MGIVFGDESFKNNPDIKDSRYNSKLGIYKEGCGIENVIMSWGHDEYLYHMLVNYMARPQDEKVMEWVKEFNKFDLYTKSTKVPDVEALKPYYQVLVDKYLPGVISF